MATERKQGRPTLPDEKAKRAVFNTRLRAELKTALEAAAKRQGRSLSEEVEFRLEQGLDRERHLVEALELGFGRQVAGLMLAIGYTIKQTIPESPPRRPGQLSWLSDPEAFGEVTEAITLLLGAIAPDGDPAAWAALRNAIHDSASPEFDSNGPFSTAVIAAHIALPETADDYIPLAQIIHDWLGAAVIARLADRLALSRNE
jgi:TraY domain